LDADYPGLGVKIARRNTSYAHYALVVIHPFADGNGRVARALASVFTYRSHSAPVLILVDNREEYYQALKDADEGRFQSFVDFVFERSVDAVQLVRDSLRASEESPGEGAARLRRVYRTTGGYGHEEVDNAGYQLFDMLLNEFTKQLEGQNLAELSLSTARIPAHKHRISRETYRYPIADGTRCAQLVFHTKQPAITQLVQYLALEVPKDCALDDDLVVLNVETQQGIEARMKELVPVPTAALRMRVSLAAQAMVGRTLRQLSDLATKALKEKGY